MCFCKFIDISFDKLIEKSIKLIASTKNSDKEVEAIKIFRGEPSNLFTKEI